MTRLCEQTLATIPADIARPTYDRGQTAVGIVHLGAGAFFRGHQAVYTEDAVAREGGNWGICAVALHSRGTVQALRDQNGLYTLAICDQRPVCRIVGIIKEAICATDEPGRVLQRLSARETKIVTLTITEKGYALTSEGRLDVTHADIQHDLQTPQRPKSAIGYLVAACRLRQQREIPPLTMISCDNVSSNGDKLRSACVDYAKQVDADLARYIAERVNFPNSMVDSITPAMDDDMLAKITSTTGVIDHAAVQREEFKQWVIEDKLPEDVPAWASVGVIICTDIAAYEQAKLTILNAAHSSLAYLGLLAGLDTVEEAIHFAPLRRFVGDMIIAESIPALDYCQGLDPRTYWSQIQTRFENPELRHRLAQISHDGSQKIPLRIFPLIRFAAQHDIVAVRACFVVAAWIHFYTVPPAHGSKPVDGYLDTLGTSLPSSELAPKAHIESFMRATGVFSEDIFSLPKIRKTIVYNVEAISAKGILTAMNEISLHE